MRLLAAWAALCVALPAFAQSTGALSVRVLNPDRLEIPGAELTLTSDALPAVRRRRTNRSGHAAFAELPEGRYNLRVGSEAGTAGVRFSIWRGVTLHLETKVVDIFEPEGINTRSTSRGTLLTAALMTRLPTAGSRRCTGSVRVCRSTLRSAGLRYQEVEMSKPKMGTQRLVAFPTHVGTASYSLSRQSVLEGYRPDPSTVRVEEFVNFFDYDYPESSGAPPLTAHLELTSSPNRGSGALLRVGVQGHHLDEHARPPLRLTFLVDVSDSMASRDRLPLVQKALHRLVGRLGLEDMVAIVTYGA